MKKTQKAKSKKSKSTNRHGAIELLSADHRKVEKLFRSFSRLCKSGNDDGKAELVELICTELTVHARVEEEIFYPELRAALADRMVLDEAEVEHRSMKDLVEDLKGMQPGDDLYDATAVVLGEWVKHHVKEEETMMFPKAKRSQIDLAEMGERMARLKSLLAAELGLAA